MSCDEKAVEWGIRWRGFRPGAPRATTGNPASIVAHSYSGLTSEVAEKFFGDDFFFLAVKRLQVGAGEEGRISNIVPESLERIAFAIGTAQAYWIDDDVPSRPELFFLH